MCQAIEPVGDARNDYDIFEGIAKELGVDDAFTAGMTAGEWIEQIYNESQTASAAAAEQAALTA